MGLFNLFKKKPVREKIKGNIAAKSGCKPIVTLQITLGFDSMYVYLIDNECIVYEIGKQDCSTVYMYENAKLAREGAFETIEYYRKEMECTVIEHGETETEAKPQLQEKTNSILTELGVSDD